MNTKETLNKKFLAERSDDCEYSILRNRIEKVDIDFVILNLLKYDYVLEINESKFDITFGLNKKSGEIGNFIKPYPNSNLLMDGNIIEKGFKEGKWYYVTDEKLNNEEFQKNKKEIKVLKKKEELKHRSDFLDMLIDSIKNEECKSAIKKLKSKLIEVESDEFYQLVNNIIKMQNI